MGKPTGFMEFTRELPARRKPEERIKDYREIYEDFSLESLQKQGARCMECGVPFCHSGCPITNFIPDWNDLVFKGRWEEALRRLHATNNFPEFTGRVCPAPCEAACVLGINLPAVTIRNIEKAIVEMGWEKGWIKPVKAAEKSGKKVAIVGSGPAGLAAAQQLARAGHEVTVFEKADRVGGLLRYGIPNYKLEKQVIDRRLAQMEAEGVKFEVNAHVGVNVDTEKLRRDFDAIVLAGGSETPRDLKVPGRELKGIHFAMDFLTQQTKRVQGDVVPEAGAILATGKRVVVIGGGDTGADCLGTSLRQGAKSVLQIEIMPKPPETRAEQTPWPDWPLQLRTESSHEEGGEREWSLNTVSFEDDKKGNVQGLKVVTVGEPPTFEAVAGSDRMIDADLVLLALGFTGPVRSGMIEQFALKLDQRGNVATDEQNMTSAEGIFAAGDLRRGQSLVVWAIAEGRKTAAGVDGWLKAKK